MYLNHIKSLLAMSLLIVVLLIAGCNGAKPEGPRVAGLTAESTVKSFFDAAKNDHINEASLYVSPLSKSDPQTVIKFMTGQMGVEQIKNFDIVSIKQVAEKGNYSAVVATIQDQNSFKIVKPIGLEKIKGQWYIVDVDQIYTNSKYKVLQGLLGNI